MRLSGFAGLPTFHRGNAAASAPLRQRPPGARPPAGRSPPRRLRRRAGARPPRRRRPLRRPRCAVGGRERAPGQGGGALPRPGAGARPDRRRPAPSPGQHGHRASSSVASATLGRVPPRKAVAARGRLARPAWRVERGGLSALRSEASAPRRYTQRRMLPGVAEVSARVETAPSLPARSIGRVFAEPRRGRGTARWARPAPSCTRPTSSPRPPTAWSSWTSTPPTSAW